MRSTTTHHHHHHHPCRRSSVSTNNAMTAPGTTTDTIEYSMQLPKTKKQKVTQLLSPKEGKDHARHSSINSGVVPFRKSAQKRHPCLVATPPPPGRAPASSTVNTGTTVQHRYTVCNRHEVNWSKRRADTLKAPLGTIRSFVIHRFWCHFNISRNVLFMSRHITSLRVTSQHVASRHVKKDSLVLGKNVVLIA